MQNAKHVIQEMLKDSLKGNNLVTPLFGQGEKRILTKTDHNTL